MFIKSSNNQKQRAFCLAIAVVMVGSLQTLGSSWSIHSYRTATPTAGSVVQFSASVFSVVEDCTSVVVTVARTGDLSGVASIDYSTSGVTASERRDYISSVGRLRFAAGESSKNFAVLINEDSAVEGLETFTLTLSNALGVSLGSLATATVQILDDASEASENSIDDPQTFVCQQYHDFLNRQPDSSGLDFWTQNITSCGSDQQCIEVKRINVSAAFFLSIEFQETGYLVERLYKVAYGDATGTSTFNGPHQLPVPIVRLNEFVSDSHEIAEGLIVGQPGWQQQLENNKQSFTAGFVQRARFTSALPGSMTEGQFVDQLNVNAGNPLSQSERNQLANDLTSGSKTRAQVLRAVAEHPVLNAAELNRAFVLMQFLGYLRRNPNDPQDVDYTGYDFWLTKLNQFGGNFVDAEMVKAFISSGEYRERGGGSVAAKAVVINKPSVFFPVLGGSNQLTTQILDAQGTPLPGTVTWTSSSPDKVSVDPSGRLVAVAIGSAQIFAESSGIKSAPTLVVVAKPQPGTLLVTDAQVVSVGPPIGLGPGQVPTVGTQYEVRLQGVVTPTPGTLVIAAETAPIAGKVVTTRQEAGALVVTLALAPLYELFSEYDINTKIDLSAFPIEDVPAQSSQNAVWNAERDRKQQATSPAPFRNFDCDGSIKPQLLGTPIQLSLENKLNLILEDRPGYSKHALEGSLALVGNAGLKLKAGFKATGRCNAQVQVRLPVFGWFSVIITPAVRVGLGAELEGEILLVQGDLGVEGKVGVSGVVGWECGGAVPACRGLDSLKPLNQFKTKTKIPSANDMQAKISAHFYVLAGLDASIGLGVLNGEILEARFGPKQSFDLAFEEDQAARTDYASSYDLKLEGVVEPGSALKEAIKKVINDDATGVTFSAQVSTDISESPKGTLSASKAKVRPGEAVDFTVTLATNTLEYWLLGYNVTGVELYRKREDELEFKQWKAMNQNASSQFVYHWVPTAGDSGKYEFAALVNTLIPVTLLEVATNSIQKVEVACFGPGSLARGINSPGASACVDSWVGTATVIARTPGTPPIDNITATSNVTWTFDHIDPFGSIFYKPTAGSFTLAFNNPSSGCTLTLSPNTFQIFNDPVAQPKLIIHNLLGQPPFYTIAGRQLVNFTSTRACPGEPTAVSQVNNFLVDYASGSGPFTVGQIKLFGNFEDAQFTNTWDFSRP